MDPVSVAASLITIIGVVGKGIQLILASRHAPEILLRLNNEVASMYLVLQAVDCIIRKHAEVVHNEEMTNLYNVLINSVKTLSKLEDLICHQLTSHNRHGEPKLDHRIWLLFGESKVRDLKEQIRVDRLELSNALSILAT